MYESEPSQQGRRAGQGRRASKRRGFSFLLLWLLTLGFVLDPLLGLAREGVLEFWGRRYAGNEALGPAMLVLAVPILLLALGIQQLHRARRAPGAVAEPTPPAPYDGY